MEIVKLSAKIIQYILDWIFPFECVSCKVLLKRKENDSPLCKTCLDKITIYPHPLCSLCKNRISKARKKQCHKGSSLIISAVTTYKEKVVRDLLHNYKYQGIHTLEPSFEKLLRRYLKVNPIPKELEKRKVILIPIPLHKTKENERGYNQSERIARIYADILKEREINTSVKTDVLRKRIKTHPQAQQKTEEARRKNISNCFSVNEFTLEKETTYILVDDILTSGATVKEAIATLRKGGLKKINVFVFALA